MAKGGSEYAAGELACQEDAGEYRRAVAHGGTGRAAGTGIQTKLHRWATDEQARRFCDLYNLVCDPAFLLVGWRRVKGNKGARSAGIDGQTAYYITAVRGEEAFLAELRADLKARRFVPLPVRERLIPKPGGQQRRLGIATIRDRVVQAALKLVLEPIFEADFHPCSYGFRPGRRAQDAIAEIHLLATHGYEWVLEGDITACLGVASHYPLAVAEDVEQSNVGRWDLDTQALSPARPHMDSAELAALDTLQHRLARHPQRAMVASS